MRPLTEDETRVFFKKLEKFIGDNIRLLIDRPEGTYCFRLQKDKVFYISEKNLKLACNIPRDNLLSMGTCFGKFPKPTKFKLQITALDFLAPYAKNKMWLKPTAEQQFLYGRNVMKSGLARITQNTVQFQGIVIFSSNEIPLGFGVTAKTALDCQQADPFAVIAFHQADIGEYLRSEHLLS